MMNLSQLTDYQLYQIIQNSRLDNGIRKLANQEFDNRKLSIDQIQALILNHDKHFKPDKEMSLQAGLKIAIVLFPFFIPIQSLFAVMWLAKGHKRKWKDYWLYLSIGYLFWTVMVIFLAKYLL